MECIQDNTLTEITVVADTMTSTGYIFDIQRYAIHDGPGIRTTVFFHGCPLQCWWCHNPECWQPVLKDACLQDRSQESQLRFIRKPNRTCQLVTSDIVLNEIMKDQVFYEQSGGGVTFSGGEPMMQMEFLLELLKTCKRNGIRTAVDTCGYAPEEDFAKIYDLVDLFLYDLKVMEDEAHRKYTGVSSELILSNLIMLSEKGGKTWLRIPLIPGITDTEENINAILEFITPLKNIQHITLLPYNNLGEDKYRRLNMPFRMGHCETQTDDELQKRKKLFEAAGYRVKIGG
jgi:pyruvate formate lyase activating enzyme